MDPINQRSLFRSEVPVFPNIFLPSIEAAIPVPPSTEFSKR